MRVVVLLLFALPALANITSSALTGRVVVDGAPVAGVSVTVTSAALQQPRTTVTDARGRYWLGALPPGTYDVTFSLAGHTTLTKRAVLELARVARADAALEPNPDEDSMTSTATTVSVADTIFPTTHFDDEALDRMPAGRIDSAALAPGNAANALLDGIPVGPVTSEETIEQLTAIPAASPVEWETFSGNVVALRTRSGGEDFFFTLRDTITSSQWNDVDAVHFPSQDDGAMHFGEATIGGRILPQRLWFFGAAWRGEQAFPYERAQEGSMVKIDAQLGASHHFDVSYNDTSRSFGFLPFESDTASLRYTAALGPRFTSEVVAGRTIVGQGGGADPPIELLSGRASYTLGDHVLTAGFAARDGGFVSGPVSLFASDRWSRSRLNVYAGLRYDESPFESRVSPRVAVSYDLHGNGARAIVATWGEYAPPAVPQNAYRLMSLGFATAIGNSGAARADAIRYEIADFWMHQLQLDARYRLFDRFEAGATYLLEKRREFEDFEPIHAEHTANVWLGAEVPVGSHEFGVTLLQRYADFTNRTQAPTDLALRYAIPFSRLGLLIAADATNVFAQGDHAFVPRALRLWLRLRI